MTLHTWNKATSTHSAFKLCLASMLKGDALLLLEDAVYLALESGFQHIAGPATSLYALSEDLAARGISARIPPSVRVVDYKDFVALCLAHDRVVNWI